MTVVLSSQPAQLRYSCKHTVHHNNIAVGNVLLCSYDVPCPVLQPLAIVLCGRRTHQHPDKSKASSVYEHIEIKHPGYNDTCDTLLTLPPLDAGGIHHETVRIACAIITGNRWEGFLTLDKPGELAVPESETILRAQRYYFHVSPSQSEFKYDVIPTFEHWPFPHGNLPLSWRGISFFKQTSRPDSDDYCRITQFEDGVEDAHLVPSAMRQWFNNNMAVYVDSTRVDKPKDSVNSIRLRSDVHTIFDAKRFTIVPIDGLLVVYCLNARLGSQIERLYHGVELHRIHDSGYLSQYLLARFAYTIFERLRAFLEANTPRKLRLRLNSETKVELCSPERCWRFARDTAFQGKSRSVSPKKRPPPDTEEPADNDDNWSETEHRGRKRCRSDESESSSPGLHTPLIYQYLATPKTPRLPSPNTKATIDNDIDWKLEGYTSHNR